MLIAVGPHIGHRHTAGALGRLHKGVDIRICPLGADQYAVVDHLVADEVKVVHGLLVALGGVQIVVEQGGGVDHGDGLSVLVGVEQLVPGHPAVGAGDVLDHKGAPGLLLQVGGQGADLQVGGAAGPEASQQGDGPVGPAAGGGVVSCGRGAAAVGLSAVSAAGQQAEAHGGRKDQSTQFFHDNFSFSICIVLI